MELNLALVIKEMKLTISVFKNMYVVGFIPALYNANNSWYHEP